MIYYFIPSYNCYKYSNLNMSRGISTKNQPNEKYSSKVYERILEDEHE